MISYRISGAGDPILLIHGLGISFPIWKDIEPILSKKFTVIMIELPGIGVSKNLTVDEGFFIKSVEAIEQLRQSLNVQKWSIVSYSIGTLVADEYLRRHSDYIDKSFYLFPVEPNIIAVQIAKVALYIDDKVPMVGNWLLSSGRLTALIRLLGFTGKNAKEIGLWYENLSKVDTQVIINTVKATIRKLKYKYKIHIGKTFFIKGKYDAVSYPNIKGQTDSYLACTHAGIHTNAVEICDIILGNL